MLRKWYFAAGLLAIAGLTVALWFYFTEKEVEGILDASGQVRGTEVTISSKLPGLVKLLPIKEGQSIKKGDLIVKLSSQEIEARRDQARSQVEAARNRLKEVEAGIKKLKAQIEEAGANVKFAKEESFHQIHQAKAALERTEADIRDAQSQRDLAKRDYEKFLRLYKEGVISKRRFEEIEARWKSTEARLEAAKGAKEEARAQLEASQATVFQVEGKEKGLQSLKSELERMKASQEVARSQIDVAIAKTKEIEATFKDTEIYAPSSGTVINKLVEEGELVAAGTPIAILIDLSEIYVRVYISETDFGKIRLGNPARIHADAFPDRFFAGRVTEISEKAEFTPKEIQMKEERTKLVFGVKVGIENPEGFLKPGMPVDVKIRWREDVPW